MSLLLVCKVDGIGSSGGGESGDWTIWEIGAEGGTGRGVSYVVLGYGGDYDVSRCFDGVEDRYGRGTDVECGPYAFNGDKLVAGRKDVLSAHVERGNVDDVACDKRRVED